MLALDTSSRCVGWSVFDNGTLTQFGRHVQDGAGHGEKLATFRAWLLEHLAEFNPTWVVYEAPYRGRNGTTFGILSRYAGVVEQCHFEFYGTEIPPENVFPAKDVKTTLGIPKVRRTTRGRGRKPTTDTVHEENKIRVLNLVNQQFGLALKYKADDKAKKVTQDDEADAIALNWAWHLRYRNPTDAEEAQND